MDDVELALPLVCQHLQPSQAWFSMSEWVARTMAVDACVHEVNVCNVAWHVGMFSACCLPPCLVLAFNQQTNKQTRLLAPVNDGVKESCCANAPAVLGSDVAVSPFMHAVPNCVCMLPFCVYNVAGAACGLQGAALLCKHG